MGKFETGYNQNEDVTNLSTTNWKTTGAEKDIIASDRVIIKPNVYSWRSIKVANAFYKVYNYKRELESHMMKNMEWGAVAYLTNSKYGRCNDNCTEVRINNSTNYVTGSSALKEPTTGYGSYTDRGDNELHTDIEGVVVNYENSLSVLSSTTGNYYGVYDMSGGAIEYVMGVMLDENGKPASGRSDIYNSNFIGTLTYPTDGTDPTKTTWTEKDGGLQWPDRRYYDSYNYDATTSSYQRGLFGDATKEIGPFYLINLSRKVSGWYSDDAFFVGNGIPWFVRGGSMSGVESGIMAFSWAAGSTYNTNTFRVILIP